MAFGLKFDIDSVFDGSGFDEADEAMSNMESASGELGLSMNELKKRMDALDMSTGSNKAFWKEGEEGSIAWADGLNELKSEQAAVASVAEEMGESVEFVESQLERSNMQLMENEEGAKRFRDTTTGAFFDTEQAVVELKDQMQTFRFDLLSVMFAAMAVERVIEGLISPALEATGVFEIISDVLTIFFLPAAQMVMKAVLGIASFFMGLPKPVKDAINVLALFVGGLAIAVKALSLFGLNTGKIMKMLGKLSAFITSKGGVIAALKAIGAAIKAKLIPPILGLVGSLSLPILIIGAIVAAIAGFALAWTKNWGGIRQKTGKAIKVIADHIHTLAKMLFLPLEPLNMLIKAINRFTDKELPTVDDALDVVQDKLNKVGDAAIESGEKFDKMKSKAPDEKQSGFVDKHMPEVGPESRFGTMGGGDNKGTQINNVNSTVNVDAAKTDDENELADKISRKQQESFRSRFRKG